MHQIRLKASPVGHVGQICHVGQFPDRVGQLLLPFWKMAQFQKYPKHGPNVASSDEFAGPEQNLSQVLEDDLDPNENNYKNQEECQVIKHCCLHPEAGNL